MPTYQLNPNYKQFARQPNPNMDYGYNLGYGSMVNYGQPPYPASAAPAVPAVPAIPAVPQFGADAIRAYNKAVAPVPAVNSQYTPYNWNDDTPNYYSLEGYTPPFTDYGIGGDPRPGLTAMQAGYMPASAGVSTSTPGSSTPGSSWMDAIGKRLGGMGKNIGEEISATPWLGEKGLLSTGLGLMNAFQNYGLSKEMTKELKGRRELMEKQGKLLKAQAGEVANRQGRLRAANAGLEADKAYEAGDRYQAEKMAKWGL